MNAAIYARVSTKDKDQTNENQLRELRAFAERLGYSVYKEYCDQESGGSAERPQFQQLFADAYQRRFDAVLFWSLDRFSREGVTETLNSLSEGVFYLNAIKADGLTILVTNWVANRGREI